MNQLLFQKKVRIANYPTRFINLHFSAALVLLCLFVALFVISWRKWPEILIDFGRELYVPWRLNEGDVLYKDLAYFNGPLSAYINAFTFKVFGTYFLTLVFLNTFITGILTYFIYRFFLVTMNLEAAFAASFSFIGIFAFAHYLDQGNFNYICPYSHELPRGILLSFCGLYVFWTLCRSQKYIYYLHAGLLISSVFLIKTEIFISLSISLGTGIFLLHFFQIIKPMKALKNLLCFLLGFLFPFLVFFLFFKTHVGFPEAFKILISPYKILVKTNVSDNPFYRKLTGMDLPIKNALLCILNALWYPLGIAMIGVLAFLRKLIRPRLYKQLFTFIAYSLGAYSIYFFVYHYPNLDNIYRGIPLLIFCIGIFYFAEILKARRDSFEALQKLPLFTVFFLVCFF